MDWKREAADKLQNYEVHKQAVDNIQEEIKRLEQDFASIRSACTDGAHGRTDSRMREDSMLSNIAHREELSRQLDVARKWIEIVDRGLNVLNDDERLVLDRLYIHRAKGNVDRLCEEMCREKSAVYDRRDKALYRFTVALYGGVES